MRAETLLGARRVRLGEPDVQGDDAGLHPEAHEEENEDEAAQRARGRGAAQEVGESERARARGEEEEPGDEAARPEVGHDEIEKRGAAARSALVIGRDERGGGEAHQLPGHEEAEDAVGREDRLDRREKHVEGHADERRPAGRNRVGQVAHAVEGHRRRQDGERHEEPRRERVHGVPDAQPAAGVREEDAADGAGRWRGPTPPRTKLASEPQAEARKAAQRHAPGGGAGRARAPRRWRGGRARAETRLSLIPATRGSTTRKRTSAIT